LVAKFTVQMIHKAITTFRKGTIRSASVGSIGILRTVITLLTGISNTITALRKDTLGSAASWGGVGVKRTSVTNFTGINSAVSAFNFASARATITILFISIITGLTASSINDSITTFRDSAPRSAGIGSILVVDTIITFLKVIQDTITTVPQHTVGSASIGLTVGVVDSVITLFTNIKDSVTADNLTSFAPSVISTTVTSLVIISDSITTEWEQASSGSASIGDSSRVSSSVIALLTSSGVDHTITAKECASSRTLRSTIALFASVDNTITAFGENAVNTAGIGGSVVVSSTIIALLSTIEGTITTSSSSTVSSATVVGSVGVVDSVVTLFILTFDAITAFKEAVSITTISVDVVTIITSLTQEIVGNTITTVRHNTGGSTSVGEVGIPQTLIALFLGINNTITAIGHSAVRSASVGEMIVVVGTIITFFLGPASIKPGNDIFLDSVTTLALRNRWKTIEDGLQDSVGGGSLGKQDRNNSQSVRSGNVGSVEQLNFEGESLGSNVMFTGFVEFNLGQGVRNSLVVEGSSGENGEQNFASGVEQHKRSGVVLNVGWVVQVQWASSGASLRETNGRLQVSSASSPGIPDGRVGTSPKGINSPRSSLSSSINFAAWEAESLSVTFLTRVNNTVSTFGCLAFSAAGIGSVVRVHSSVVTFLTNFNDSVSTHGPSTTIHGSISNTRGGLNLVVDWESSVSVLSKSRVGSSNHISE
jgi:hypothetical protein